VEGQTIGIEYRWTEGRDEQFPGFAAELVRLKVDAIVTWGTPAALAAKNATTTIPIVMAASGDPVGTGLVASLARPGGNVTGLSGLNWELEGKRLELLKEVVLKLSRVAVLWNSGNPLHVILLKETHGVAWALGVQLQPVAVQGSVDLDNAFAKMTKERPDALIVEADAFFVTQRRRIVDFTAKTQLPAIYTHRDFVDAGGLMTYGASYPDLFRRAAYYVDKILKGAKPADLPVEQPTKFELVINLKTAKALGLTIPQSILIRADEVIR
jgi:putative ABC transport system substrate-binding protein